MTQNEAHHASARRLWERAMRTRSHVSRAFLVAELARGHPASASRIALAAARDDDARERALAASVLGALASSRTDARRSRAALVRLVGDPRASVVAAAAAALASFAPFFGARSVYTGLAVSSERSVRMAAAHTLAHWASEGRQWPLVLLGSLSVSADANTRWTAIFGLANAPIASSAGRETATRQWLSRAASDEDAEVAIEALGGLVLHGVASRALVVEVLQRRDVLRLPAFVLAEALAPMPRRSAQFSIARVERSVGRRLTRLRAEMAKDGE